MAYQLRFVVLFMFFLVFVSTDSLANTCDMDDMLNELGPIYIETCQQEDLDSYVCTNSEFWKDIEERYGQEYAQQILNNIGRWEVLEDRYGQEIVRRLSSACVGVAVTTLSAGKLTSHDYLGDCPDIRFKWADKIVATGLEKVADVCGECPPDGWYDVWQTAFPNQSLPQALQACVPANPDADHSKPQEEDDGHQPAYPPGGMPQAGEDYGPGRFPIPQAPTADETLRNLMAILGEIGLASMSRIVGQVADGAFYITFSDGASWSREFNTLFLEDPLTSEDLDVNDRSLLPGVVTHFEESVHGYMDLFSETELVRNITNAGRAAYEEAIVEDAAGNNRRQTEQPEIVFQEAVAGYVAHRVQTFYHTLDKLGAYRARGILTEENVETIRRIYNEAMAKRTFGYENSSDGQLPTILELPEAMRQIIDHELLGGEIPDSFDDVEQFRRVLDN